MAFFRAVINFFKDKQYRELLLFSLLTLCLGMFAYSHLEGWSYLDSLYFSIITLTTVGYGDFSPQTSGGKVFTIFYIFIGLGMILTFLQTVFDHFKNEIYITEIERELEKEKQKRRKKKLKHKEKAKKEKE